MFTHIINISKYRQKDGTYIFDIGGDPHIGSNNASESHFIEFLESPYPKFLLGDLLEAIGPMDKRFYHGKHNNPIMEAFFYLKHLLVKHNIENPTAGDVIGLLKGNHESVVFSKFGNLYNSIYTTEDGEDVPGGLCNELGIAYGGFISMFVLEDGGHRSCWMLTHGKLTFNAKAGEEERKQTNKKIRVRDHMKGICQANLYACGHGHQLVLSPPPKKQKMVYDPINRTMAMKSVPIGDSAFYCMTGSFMKVYETNVDGNYAEEMLVEPSDIGWVRVFMDKDLNIIDMKGIPDAL